jgi:hypothetical protein
VGDLSITALYTSQVWAWGGLPCADLLATVDGKRVFDVTNAALSLARLARPELPELRVSLLHRHVIIDRLLGDAHDIVEIAAGLSRRGAANCDRNYTEIDLPAVIVKKTQLLGRTEAGRAVLENLRLIGGDVTTMVIPTAELVIAEGLLMYLDGPARRQLFASITSPRLVFDLVPTSEQPAPGRVGALLEAAMKKFTGGRSFERDADTRAQIIDELHAAGFEQVDVHTPTPDLPHGDKPSLMVVFNASRATRA